MATPPVPDDVRRWIDRQEPAERPGLSRAWEVAGLAAPPAPPPAPTGSPTCCVCCRYGGAYAVCPEFRTTVFDGIEL